MSVTPARTSILINLTLLIVTFAVYGRIVGHDFIVLDDIDNIKNNLHLQEGFTLEALRWAFTTTHSGNWHPITWLSHILDMQLYGLKPGGHHLTNLLLHTANTLLLFRFLSLCTNTEWRSAFVAALFALHPLHVESVAWAAERKDVLSTLFFLLTLISYRTYLQRRSTGRYLLPVVLFILGLMSKPMLVSLPLVLFMLDYWPLGRFSCVNEPSSQPLPVVRIRTVFVEKLPFVILSASSCLVTYYAQSGKAVSTDIALPLSVRLQNAIISYGAYLYDMVWPESLAVFYPLTVPVHFMPVILSGVTLAVITFLVISASRTYPYLLTGWCWYLVTLLPTVGLIQVGLQSRADRYTYIPMTGVFIMLTWGAADLIKRWHFSRRVSWTTAILILLMLSIQCYRQVSLWRNTLTLFTHTLSVTRNNYYAALVVGNEYRSTRDMETAIGYFNMALTFSPNGSVVHMVECDLASTLGALGRYDEAIRHYQAAINANPQSANTFAMLAELLELKEDLPDALRYYRRSLELDPTQAEIRLKLALVMVRQGNKMEAYPHFVEVLRQQPDNPDALNAVGIFHALQGNRQAAADYFTRAIQQRPTFIDAQHNLDRLLEGKSR